jgi:hypothetical protein
MLNYICPVPNQEGELPIFTPAREKERKLSRENGDEQSAEAGVGTADTSKSFLQKQVKPTADISHTIGRQVRAPSSSTSSHGNLGIHRWKE